ncbi:CPBP family intramembrane metalloprotease [Psychroflexus sp. YR1-1]|uniref:CPBP family intramembrane metalloprotease n=1 Tax=Psychroflexus aurantiacus TaxID=2709310 RepID=A0A6B3R113_9FLAO|nr:CPBP family intramembrane glutamic endopeptidase [Psychroflexus aurantiacus]NEV94313.1 CPBP family intramembrane metalloprotease [Psychroflexus aurantiacus]
MRDFIALASKGYHEWWRYLVGTFLIFIIWQVGTLPFIGAVSYKLAIDGGDLSSLGNYETLMGTLDSNLTFFLMLLSFAVGFFGVWLIVRFFHNQKFKDVLTTRQYFDWNRVFIGFSIVGFFIAAMTILDFTLNPDSFLWNLKWDQFLILAGIGIIMVPIQTTFEEIYFRGYLMQGIGVIFKNRWLPLILTSVGFGLLHLGNPEVGKLGYVIMISYIGTGFLLAIMALMDEGLELSIGFHAGNNLITALLVTADWTAFQTESILIYTTEPSVGFDVLIPVLVIYPVYLFIMAKIYNWKNWKSKLFGRVEVPKTSS